MKNLILLSILIPSLTFGQKIKHDKETGAVFIDGKKSFNIIREGCGMGMPDCHFDIYDRHEEKVIRINYRSFNSPTNVSSSNPDGTVRYFEFIFLESEKKSETNFVVMKPQRVAKFLIDNGLMKNGELDEDAVKEFVLVHGTSYSDRRRD